VSAIRVLHVVATAGSRDGGIESIVHSILRGHDRARFRHDVCCITGMEGSEEAAALGAEVLFCRKSVDLWGFAARFEALLAGRGYDVVHSHVNAWSGPLLRGAEKAGVPVRVAHVHSAAASLTGRNLGFNPPGRLAAAFVDALGVRWIARHATHVLGVSAASLDPHWPGWRSEPGRFMLWAGGVDAERFSPAAAPRAGAPAIVSVGAFSPDKNHAASLDVLAEVRRRVPGAVLTVAGDGPRFADVERRARAAEPGSVRLLGARSDIPDLLRDADLFLSSSLREGLPQAVLEAQAAGLPVVASDIPAHREALAPELREFLFPRGDAGAAAGHAVRLLESPALRAAAGAAARRFILEKWTHRARLDRLQGWHEAWTAAARGKP
jgi:glycosyltransferase involved in cell wall biosynthesis